MSGAGAPREKRTIGVQLTGDSNSDSDLISGFGNGKEKYEQ